MENISIICVTPQSKVLLLWNQFSQDSSSFSSVL